MKNRAVFLKCTEEVTISPTATPEFYRLYKQTVLLALKEQGVLNDRQLRYALDLLHQTRGEIG